MKGLILILHNVRSVHNVGAIFRTADGAGVKKIYLTGYTPTPFDRFGRVRNDFHKAALGAENTVPWEQIKSASRLIDKLHGDGVQVLALEQDDRSVDYRKLKLGNPVSKSDGDRIALLVGNEVRGVSKALLGKCDQIIDIPMMGQKESLNVSVATGIALYSLHSLADGDQGAR